MLLLAWFTASFLCGATVSTSTASQTSTPKWVDEVCLACIDHLKASEHAFKKSGIAGLENAKWRLEFDQLSAKRVYRSQNITMANTGKVDEYCVTLEWNDNNGSMVTLQMIAKRKSKSEFSVKSERSWKNRLR